MVLVSDGNYMLNVNNSNTRTNYVLVFFSIYLSFGVEYIVIPTFICHLRLPRHPEDQTRVRLVCKVCIQPVIICSELTIETYC